MIEYRKLTDQEVKTLADQLSGKLSKPTQLQSEIYQHVAKYYPKTASSAILTVNSEYNDNTYDNTPGVLVVYDANGLEIVPLPKTARDCRNQWKNFTVPYETKNQIFDDIVVNIKPQTIPDIYIKKP